MQLDDDTFQQMIANDPDLQTVSLKQISDHYAVSMRLLNRYIEQGSLHAVKLGRHYIVTIASLKLFLSATSRGTQDSLSRTINEMYEEEQQGRRAADRQM